MLVDTEKVLLGLKARIREKAREGKRSWGSNELLELLADLEVDHRLPEGQDLYDDRPAPRGHTSSGHASHDEPVALASGAS